jgi:HAD superfamily hydrolase (TIGR01459 family)
MTLLRGIVRARRIEGLSELVAGYDGFVLDLWGTLHDGVRPYPGVVLALRRLLERGTALVALSNAPRRAAEVGASMIALGLPKDSAARVMCSGEEAFRALAERSDPWYRRLGRRGFHLGPERDRGMLDNPGFTVADRLDRAEFVLCTGLDRPEDTVADYRPVLEQAAARSLPMICANPDYEVLRGDRRELCAGALALVYERELGGEVRWHGKPHASVFASALALMPGIDPRRVLVVGDSLRTDIAGASGAGLASAFVTGGIALATLGGVWGSTPDEASLAALFAAAGVEPDWVLPAFRWETAP